MSSNRVSFRTVDGATLRGDLFLAPPQPKGTPIIIMTQGLTLLKEHNLHPWAQLFLHHGYSVLIYDHRSWGSSDGSPRQSVNPVKQAEDMHDAVLFARSLPEIDGGRIAVWGIGHSSGACMIVAGDDPYVKAVILMMPFFSGGLDAGNYPDGMEARIRAERERLVSDPAAKAEYIQVWDNSAAEAASGRGQILLHGPEAWGFVSGAKKLSDVAGMPWENKMTLMSLYDIAKVEPRDHIWKIAPRPLLYLAASVDALSGPVEKQRMVSERAGEPKAFVELKEHHLANYEGELFEENGRMQLEFLGTHL